MAEHAENEPSNTARAARSAPSRRRTSTPPTDTEANLSADIEAVEPGSALTLDLFGEGHEPAPESEAQDTVPAASAKESRAAPARRAARTKAAAEPVEDAVNAGGGGPDDSAAARAHSEAPQPSATAEHETAEPDRPNDEAACTQASGTAVPAPGALEPRDVPDAVAQMQQLAATEAATASAPPQPEATAAQESAPPAPEPVPGLHGATNEPAVLPLPASGFSYAATSATGNPARMISVVHAADVDAAVQGFVPERAASLGAERAVAGLPTEIVAAMAAQTRRTKWMLTTAVTALVVTAGVAIAQTLLLASLSADTAAQQQRFDVLMQNQQAALDSVAARLAAPAAAAVAAAPMPQPAAAGTGAARAQPTATPPHHAARAAKAPKSPEKSPSRAAGSAPSKTHSQHATPSRQAAAKS